jgi:hypothetical protein
MVSNIYYIIKSNKDIITSFGLTSIIPTKYVSIANILSVKTEISCVNLAI